MPAETSPTVARQVVRGLGWAGLAVAALLTAAIALPLAFGARPHTVLTGSMEPTIAAGDVVIDARIAPTAAAVGDVVTFRDPDDQSRLITHRVRSIRRAGSYLWFVTQGDANNTTEHWRIAADGELGRVAYTVPWVGHVAVLTHTRLGLALFLLVPLLLLGLDELTRIWRPAAREEVPYEAP
jgi:signal peptidase